MAIDVNGAQRFGLISDDQAKAVRLDKGTHALETIDYAHHEIHAGSHFFANILTSISSAASFSISIHTPNTTKWPHMMFEVGGIYGTKIELFETAILTSGTAMTAVNSNRNSATAATITCTSSPTVTTSGTLLLTDQYGFSTGSGPSGLAGSGNTRSDNEIILKQNTVYLLKVTAVGSDNTVPITLEWYEHTDKN